MRPLRLELRGFMAFREEQVIDFGDAGYFALVGPTGSGKSTVIDAICFALYGSVPRLNDRRAVAPVISGRGLEARVRFDFSLARSTYSAVRVVERDQRGGAKTRAAKLERDGEVLAGTGPELTAEIERLIGLPFDHFTRCVALPQGEFARFLHDDRKDRQDLVVKLLRLGAYKTMGERARELAAGARKEADLLQQRLDNELAFATAQALAEAKERETSLKALQTEVEVAKPRLEELADGAKATSEAAEQKAGLATTLASVATPPDVAELADGLAHASKLVEEAAGALEAAEQRTAGAAQTLAALPQRDPLVTALDTHEARERLAGETGTQRRAEAAALKDEEAARRALKDAEAAHEATVAHRDAAVEADTARHLAGTLVVGETCPVCLQVIQDLPSLATAPELDAGRAAVDQALKAKNQAQDHFNRASGLRLRASERVALLESQVAALVDRLATTPDKAAVEVLLTDIDGAQTALEKAGRGEREASAAHKRATAEFESLKADENRARDSFEALRDKLIPLVPPPVARSNLAADWAGLVAWAGSKAPGVAKEVAAASRKAGELADERARLVEGLEARCRDCAVELDGGELDSAVVRALTRAETLVERIEEAHATVARVRAEIKKLKHEGDVAATLGGHLRIEKFENWIVNEALQRLVEGGSLILRELTNGSYSLGITQAGDFQVIDHHNADEVRSARTLSGGETFLASLSLALALADQLSQLAAEGASRLDAIFLDEGFGTLDPETLDTVAATVENLAAGGRMVGIVTHVRELAERVPVQFRVTKDARTARVEKVTA